MTKRRGVLSEPLFHHVEEYDITSLVALNLLEDVQKYTC